MSASLRNFETLRLFLVSGVRDCRPSDFIFEQENFGDVTYECYKDCVRSKFEESIAISEVVGDAIDAYQAGIPDDVYKMDPRYRYGNLKAPLTISTN